MSFNILASSLSCNKIKDLFYFFNSVGQITIKINHISLEVKLNKIKMRLEIY